MTGGVALRFLPLLLLTSGCAVFQREPVPPLPPAQVEVIEDKVPIAWREVATPADQERLDHLAEAWSSGLEAAARFKSAIAAEGALLDPAAALPRAAPSPGPYLCRVVKLGGRPALAAFKPFNCFVDAEGELLTMVKSNGTLRPAGRLWTDTDTRMIFLGGLAAPNRDPPAYGDNGTRNVAGVLERVAPFRWRLAVPYPQAGGTLDVYELAPLIPGASIPARP
jgi:hypothetical protein